MSIIISIDQIPLLCPSEVYSLHHRFVEMLKSHCCSSSTHAASLINTQQLHPFLHLQQPQQPQQQQHSQLHVSPHLTTPIIPSNNFRKTQKFDSNNVSNNSSSSSSSSSPVKSTLDYIHYPLITSGTGLISNNDKLIKMQNNPSRNDSTYFSKVFQQKDLIHQMTKAQLVKPMRLLFNELPNLNTSFMWLKEVIELNLISD